MKTILSAALAVMLALSTMVASAQDKAADKADRKVELSIEQQSLADALNEWAKQTGLQLVSSSSEMMNTTLAPTIKGEYTPKGALEELLKGTSLTYEWVGDRAVAIREQSPIVPAALQTSREEKQQPIQATKLRVDESHGWRLVDNRPDVPQKAGDASSARTSLDSQDVEDLEEIIVTGTHIRGVSNSTAPVIVLSKAYIDSTGYSTTTQLLESLPQNFALANQVGVNTPGVSGAGEQGAAINLRGLGEGTTLTLINGRRMALGFASSAVDISALPLSAIERVEILTDGASAIYGSDAVGGVVNFILRSDFDGAETRARAGQAKGGLHEYQISQALGHTWASGNAVFAAEYFKRDLLASEDRDFVPPESQIGSLLPEDKNISAMFSGRQALGSRTSLFADFLYMNRDSFNQSGRVTLNQSNEVDNPQMTGSVGVDLRFANDWQLEVSTGYAENNADVINRGSQILEGEQLNEQRSRIKSAEMKVDGPVLSLPGGEVRAVVGVDWRSDEYSQQITHPSGLTAVDFDSSAIVRSAFAELVLPVVGPGNAVSAARRVELSIAGRYGDYSKFGSSVDPKVGIAWFPSDALKLRASWGTSYRAPRLYDYNSSSNLAIALTSLDPGTGGVSRQLQVFGTDTASLKPQESESFSVGFDWSSTPLRVSVNYYNIKYEEQIANPPFDATVILGNPASFGDLIIRNPSSDDVNRYIAASTAGFFAFNPDFTFDTNFDPSTIAVITDQRRRNLSVSKTDGIDGLAQYSTGSAVGRFTVSLGGTYILELERQITASSVPFDSVDTFSNPPKLRLRGSVSWQGTSWAMDLFVNHVGSYTDNRVPNAPVDISSYTTADARVAYDFGDTSGEGFGNGLVIALSALNLLDRDPPRTAIVSAIGDLGFDPVNASPLGRMVALEISKKF